MWVGIPEMTALTLDTRQAGARISRVTDKNHLLARSGVYHAVQTAKVLLAH